MPAVEPGTSSTNDLSDDGCTPSSHNTRKRLVQEEKRKASGVFSENFCRRRWVVDNARPFRRMSRWTQIYPHRASGGEGIAAILAIFLRQRVQAALRQSWA